MASKQYNMLDMETQSQLPIIGSTEFVEIAGAKKIPAKIDTGADTSAIWASNIDMDKDGILSFALFDQGSPFYTDERISTVDYHIKKVRSSHGDQQIRYQVKLPITINNETFETTFTLADRSRNRFPVLIGRHTLEGKYIVDVSRSQVPHAGLLKSAKLTAELKEDPYSFHQRHFNGEGNL